MAAIAQNLKSMLNAAKNLSAINLTKRYSIAEVARITGKHRNTIANHINAGYLRAHESRRNIRPAEKGGAPRKALAILGRDLQTYLNTY